MTKISIEQEVSSMVKLGETVRQIRTNKGLTLADVADDQVTLSFLSKFERGVADITTTKFLHVLAQIFTTPEEFFYIHSGDNQDGYFNRTIMLGRLFGEDMSLADRPDIAETKADLAAREKAAATQYHAAPTLLNMLHWRVQQLMTQEVIGMLTKQPPVRTDSTGKYSHEALHYLYNVNDWGEFELYVFTIFAVDMQIDDERRLFQVAVKRSEKYSQFHGAPKLCFDIMANQLYLEMNRRAYAMVGEYLPQYAALLDKTPDAEHEITYRFIRAWWLFRTDQREAGKTIGDSAVQLAKALRMKDVAADVRAKLDLIATHGAERDYSFFQQVIE
jgi:Rgg/GadR/MutR family transcriptional activator